MTTVKGGRAMAMTHPATRSVWRRIPWRKVIAFCLVVPLAIMFLIPLYWMVIASFKSREEVWAWPIKWWPHRFLWRN